MGSHFSPDDLQRAIAMYSSANAPAVQLGATAPMASPSSAPASLPTQPGVSPFPQKGDYVGLKSFLSTDPRYRPWFDEFKKNYGSEPEVNDPDYDYHAAITNGIVPEPYTDAKGKTTYHWASSTPDGSMLKSANHPTAWMEYFMRVTGKDPNRVGVADARQALDYISRDKTAGAGMRPEERAQMLSGLQHSAQLQASGAAANQDQVAAPPGKLIPVDAPPERAPAAPQDAAPAPMARAAMDADLLAQKPPASAQGEQPMNLGNWRPEMMRAYDTNAKAHKAIADDFTQAADRASLDRDIAFQMHQEDSRANDERRKLAEEHWSTEGKRILEQKSQLDALAAHTEIRDRRSIAQRAMGAIALGLGQATDQNNLVAGLMQGTPVETHNADAIQDNINASIDRDLETQKANLANLRDQAHAKLTEYGMAREMFQDDNAATEYVKGSLQQRYGMELERIAGTLGNAELSARAKAAGQDQILKGKEGQANILAAYEAQKKAEAAARAAAAAKGPDYGSRRLEDIKRLIDAHLAPASAVAYYNEQIAKGLENDAKTAGIAKTKADTEKAAREAAGGGEMKAEAAKALRLYQSVEKPVARLEEMVSKLDSAGSSDVPGVGPISGNLPSWATSSEGLQVRRDTRKMLKAQLRDESGAAISDDELTAYMNDRNMGENSTNADFLAGLRDALTEFKDKREIVRKAAGLDPSAPIPKTPYQQMLEDAMNKYGARPRQD